MEIGIRDRSWCLLSSLSTSSSLWSVRNVLDEMYLSDPVQAPVLFSAAIYLSLSLAMRSFERTERLLVIKPKLVLICESLRKPPSWVLLMYVRLRLYNGRRDYQYVDCNALCLILTSLLQLSYRSPVQHLLESPNQGQFEEKPLVFLLHKRIISSFRVLPYR
jgi:hypothetical protein